MDTKRKINIGFLVLILIGVSGCNSIDQGTNTPSKKEHTIKLPKTISFFETDNKLLDKAGKRLFLPFLQTNLNTRVFRVVAITGKLTEEKKHIPYVTKVRQEVVMLEVVYAV